MKRNLQTVEGSDNTKQFAIYFPVSGIRIAGTWGSDSTGHSAGSFVPLRTPWFFSPIWGTRRADHRDRNGLNRFWLMFLAVHDLRISFVSVGPCYLPGTRARGVFPARSGRAQSRQRYIRSPRLVFLPGYLSGHSIVKSYPEIFVTRLNIATPWIVSRDSGKYLHVSEASNRADYSNSCNC